MESDGFSGKKDRFLYRHNLFHEKRFQTKAVVTLCYTLLPGVKETSDLVFVDEDEFPLVVGQQVRQVCSERLHLALKRMELAVASGC